MRVDHCAAGAHIPSCVCPYPFHQRRTDLFPKPASDCGVIKIRRCCVRWKTVGQISPFAAVICKIQHRVCQFPLFLFPPVSCSGKQRRYDRPLTVAQSVRITASLIFLYRVPIIALSFPLVQLLNDTYLDAWSVKGKGPAYERWAKVYNLKQMAARSESGVTWLNRGLMRDFSPS